MVKKFLLTVGFAIGGVLVLSACNPFEDVTQVAAGGLHTCALSADGTVACWGANTYGQLGDGTFTFTIASSPVAVSGLTNATTITAGGLHTCAVVTDNGELFYAGCWGRNDSGQLGDGTFAATTSPVGVSGLTNATTITAGGEHTCALRTDGTVACWGDNGNGQLGDGYHTNRPAPVAVLVRR